ncbi:hypothetical protein [Clostridium sp.]|uniref:hypothetical protein n=1 Tax=Clostridium sp. TaxID=1506 RepID=UPI003D6D2307
MNRVDMSKMLHEHTGDMLTNTLNSIPEGVSKMYTDNALIYFKGKQNLTINPNIRD